MAQAQIIVIGARKPLFGRKNGLFGPALYGLALGFVAGMFAILSLLLSR